MLQSVVLYNEHTYFFINIIYVCRTFCERNPPVTKCSLEHYSLPYTGDNLHLKENNKLILICWQPQQNSARTSHKEFSC